MQCLGCTVEYRRGCEGCWIQKEVCRRRRCVGCRIYDAVCRIEDTGDRVSVIGIDRKVE